MCTGGSCFVTAKGRDLKKARASRALEVLAEAVGFEPTVPFGTTVFKTAPINRSGTPPFSCLDVSLFYYIKIFCQDISKKQLISN